VVLGLDAVEGAMGIPTLGICRSRSLGGDTATSVDQRLNIELEFIVGRVVVVDVVVVTVTCAAAVVVSRAAAVDEVVFLPAMLLRDR